jgi:hypothetical protein
VDYSGGLTVCERWYDLIAAAEWLMELGIDQEWIADSTRNSERSLRWTGARTAGHTPDSILTLLLRHRNAQASDPRDKVFALSGLASDPEVVEIDYSKTTEEVCINTAVNLIYRYRNLDVLSTAELRDSLAKDITNQNQHQLPT